MKNYLPAALLLLTIQHADGQNVGIGTTSPLARLHVADSAVLFTGPPTVPGISNFPPPVSGPGTRMMWYPQKGAFRVGTVDDNSWDKEAVGQYSFATGYNSRAVAVVSATFGEGNVAEGEASVATGFSTVAKGGGAFSMGFGTKAISNSSLAIGNYNDSTAGPNERLFEIGNGTSRFNRSNAFTVLSNGQVGIGTVRPGYPFVSTNRILEIYNSDQNDGRSTIFLTDSTNKGSMGGITWRSKFIPLSDGLIGNISTSMENSGYPAYPKGAMHFSTSDQNNLQERLTINALGNIGIGNTAPNAPLQFGNGLGNRKIVLSETVNNDHQFFGFGINAAMLRYQTDALTSDHVFFAATTASTSQELMRIKGNGNVGVGNNPAYRLDVTGRVRIRQGNDGEPGIFLNKTDNSGLASFIGLQNSNQVGFYGAQGAGWGLTMNNTNGYVGIGATANAQLQFGNNFTNRKIVLWETANNEHQFYGFGINSTQLRYQVDATVADHIFFAATSSTTSNELMRIKGNGFVGIGTSNPTQALQVAGNILASGTITPSDARYKKNIAPITDPLEKLEQLNGVTYNYRPEEFPDMKFSEREQVGLIAQDVEKVFPQLVFEDDKGYKGVDYVKLIPLLVEALKSQEKQVKTLELQNKLLQEQNKQQQAQYKLQQQQIETLIEKIDSITKK